MAGELWVCTGTGSAFVTIDGVSYTLQKPGTNPAARIAQVCYEWVALTPTTTLESVGMAPADIFEASGILAGSLVALALTAVVAGSAIGLFARGFKASEDS